MTLNIYNSKQYKRPNKFSICPECNRHTDALDYCYFCGGDLCGIYFNQIKMKDDINDMKIITFFDSNFIRGGYFMLWTLLKSNNCDATVYYVGIDLDDPMIIQMKNWGVKFKDASKLIKVPMSIKGWQTFNKPFYIRDALKDNDKVFWIDCDTSIAGGINSASKILDSTAFIPDHGYYDAFENQNPKEITDIFGEPRTTWKGKYHPCAGILGFNKKRQADDSLLTEWEERTKELMKYSKEIIEKVKFYDQGILQDIITCDVKLQDGYKWNNFKVIRYGTVFQMMKQTFEYDHIICHYGGVMKPWFNWDSILSWPNPTKERMI